MKMLVTVSLSRSMKHLTVKFENESKFIKSFKCCNSEKFQQYLKLKITNSNYHACTVFECFKYRLTFIIHSVMHINMTPRAHYLTVSLVVK